MAGKEHPGWMKDWVNDFALGELCPEREPELLAHAMECDACREALAHAKRVREMVDRGVETLVEGEPGPEFGARLRSRIAQEPVPAKPNWVAWLSAEPGAARLISFRAAVLVLAAILAIVVARRPRHEVVAPVITEATTTVPADLPVASATPQTTGSSHRSRAPVTPRATYRNTRQSEPEILVPKGELSVLMRFNEAIRSGRADGAQLYAAQQEAQAPVELKPIEIAPLDFPDPPPTDASSGPGLP
jgi:anti-sigma factor RsiW